MMPLPLGDIARQGMFRFLARRSPIAGPAPVAARTDAPVAARADDPMRPLTGGPAAA
jgi:hypothetical protein